MMNIGGDEIAKIESILYELQSRNKSNQKLLEPELIMEEFETSKEVAKLYNAKIGYRPNHK